MDTSESNGPKKYIRTFEGDMKTVQEGGIPNLTPLEDAHKPASAAAPAPVQGPTAKEPPVAPPSVTPLPPAETPKVQPPPPASVTPPKGPPPLDPTPVSPPPVVKTAPPVDPLKTYAGDFGDRMKDTHASTATILAAEQDSKKGAPVVTAHNPPHYNLPFVVGGIILLIGAGVGVYAAYVHYTNVSLPITIRPSMTAPIFVDDREPISGTSTALFQAIQNSVNRPLTSGTVRLLYTTSTTTNTTIFGALDASAPDILLRNINKEGSMAGVVNSGGNQNPFFILSVTSYSNTFSGMLSWESRMARDLSTLFPPYSSPDVTTTASTTASTVTKNPATFIAFFHDEVVSNHDVRVYRDATGQSIILYGYWDPYTLVIARDTTAFIELLERLATARTP